MNSFEWPTTAGSLSVVTDTSMNTRSWVFSIKFLKDWKNILFPACFLSRAILLTAPLLNTIPIKMHNCVVSFLFVDAPNCSEKHSQSAMPFQSRCVKSSAMTSQRRVTVFLDSWRALIEDNILFKVLKQEDSCFNKCLFYDLPILEGLLMLNYGVTHPEWCLNSFFLRSALWKNISFRTTVVFSLFTFVCQSLLFRWNLMSTFYERP